LLPASAEGAASQGGALPSSLGIIPSTYAASRGDLRCRSQRST